MPVAIISTSTSPALGPSRSTSTISSGLLASNATAARVFIQSVSFEEAADPVGHGLIIVRRIERGDSHVGRVHAVVTLLDQRLRVADREFRMELKTYCWPVGPGERRERREIGRGDDVGIGRLRDDLVLVRRRNSDFHFAVGPWLLPNHIIAL